MYKFLSPGNNITEVIRVKDKFNQLFQDKLFLVMLVLGLLTIVAAAGAITIQRGNTPGENPYMQMEEPGKLMAEETQEEKEPMIEIVEQTVGQRAVRRSRIAARMPRRRDLRIHM